MQRTKCRHRWAGEEEKGNKETLSTELRLFNLSKQLWKCYQGLMISNVKIIGAHSLIFASYLINTPSTHLSFIKCPSLFFRQGHLFESGPLFSQIIYGNSFSLNLWTKKHRIVVGQELNSDHINGSTVFFFHLWYLQGFITSFLH